MIRLNTTTPNINNEASPCCLTALQAHWYYSIIGLPTTIYVDINMLYNRGNADKEYFTSKHVWRSFDINSGFCEHPDSFASLSI